MINHTESLKDGEEILQARAWRSRRSRNFETGWSWWIKTILRWADESGRHESVGGFRPKYFGKIRGLYWVQKWTQQDPGLKEAKCLISVIWGVDGNWGRGNGDVTWHWQWCIPDSDYNNSHSLIVPLRCCRLTFYHLLPASRVQPQPFFCGITQHGLLCR